MQEFMQQIYESPSISLFNAISSLSMLTLVSNLDDNSTWLPESAIAFSSLSSADLRTVGHDTFVLAISCSFS